MLMDSSLLIDPQAFTEALYAKMKLVNPGVEEMELYEFRYGLDNLFPAEGGWAGVQLEPLEDIERCIESSSFYEGIQIKPRVGADIVMDAQVVQLANMLFAGLVQGAYPVEW